MIRVSVAVAVVMMVVAGFFTVNAVLAVILLKMVKYYGVLCVALGFNANVSLFKFVVLRRLGTLFCKKSMHSNTITACKLVQAFFI